MKLCECNCGFEVRLDKHKFIHGHNNRMGNQAKRKGKSYEQICGLEKAKEWKEKQSIIKKDKPINVKTLKALREGYNKWKNTDEAKKFFKQNFEGEKNPAKRIEVQEKMKKNHWSKNDKIRNDVINNFIIKKTGKKVNHKGTTSLKGKTYEEIMGKEKGKELRIIRSISLKGKKRKEESVINTVESLSKKFVKQLYDKNGKKISANTKPELAMESMLLTAKIPYEKQKRFGRYIYDFYLFNHNIIIEVDGIYWHNLPGAKEHDKLKDENIQQRIVENNIFTEKGLIIIKKHLKIFRFSDKEIYVNPSGVFNKIITITKEFPLL